MGGWVVGGGGVGEKNGSGGWAERSRGIRVSSNTDSQTGSANNTDTCPVTLYHQ